MAPKKFGFASTAILIVAGLVVLTVVFTRHGHLMSEAQASPVRQPAANTGVASATSDSTHELPPGTIAYQAKAYTTAQFLARNHLTDSKYMTVAEYVDAIAADNNGKKTFKRGDTVLIPGIEPQPIVEKIRPFPKDGEVRAIYMTGDTAGSAYGIDLVRRWHDAGGNAVVFDIKDSDGTINVPFQHPLARKLTHYPISNLPKYVRFLHSMGMHVIARQALFRDDNIAQHHSELAVQSRSMHRPWLENGKQVWADPSRKEVQDYNLNLAKYVAGSGVDEIQFDYVRFPAEGNQPDAQFAFEKNPTLHRDDVIAGFLDRAYSELHPMGVLVSIDVFGVMAWQRKVDLNHTGQDIVKMAKHCDIVSPMIYPSHFFGMDGYKDPGDAPEHFISVSMDRYVKVTAGSGAVIRPWLQAFHWRTKTYSPEYILTQVRTSNQHGGIGFLFWNAANNYSKPFDAMPVIMKNPREYLHTPGVTVAQNSLSAASAGTTAPTQGGKTPAAGSGAGQQH